jgi:hypothetical protein
MFRSVESVRAYTLPASYRALLPKDVQQVYRSQFYLSRTVLERLERDGLPMPARCCVCGSRGTRSLDIAHPSWMRRRGWEANRQEAPWLARHCDHHSHGEVPWAALVVEVLFAKTRHMALRVHGANAEYLVEWRQLCMRGDFYPPWEAYAGATPGAGKFATGWEHAWWADAWCPYWIALPHRDAQALLNDRQTSPEWRECLATLRRI